MRLATAGVRIIHTVAPPVRSAAHPKVARQAMSTIARLGGAPSGDTSRCMRSIEAHGSVRRMRPKLAVLPPNAGSSAESAPWLRGWPRRRGPAGPAMQAVRLSHTVQPEAESLVGVRGDRPRQLWRLHPSQRGNRAVEQPGQHCCRNAQRNERTKRGRRLAPIAPAALASNQHPAQRRQQHEHEPADVVQ